MGLSFPIRKTPLSRIAVGFVALFSIDFPEASLFLRGAIARSLLTAAAVDITPLTAFNEGPSSLLTCVKQHQLVPASCIVWDAGLMLGENRQDES